MAIDCLNCINSACCKLEVDISKKEYDMLGKDIKDKFILNSEEFISQFPIWASKKEHINNNSISMYATIKRMADGYCYFLNRMTMECGIHDQKPQTCKEYSTDKCENIRHLCTS